MQKTNSTIDYLGFKKIEVDYVGQLLNTTLANYHVYYQNLRNFHWNIYGSSFFDLHDKFEALYNDARLKIDEIAERILTLRLQPMSKMSEYLKLARIDESEILNNDRDMVLVILNNHKVLIETMREIIHAAGEIKDEGTVDMIGGFLSDLEKKSWMLDAWSMRKD